MTELRDIWEETSFELEKLQANYKCVNSEKEGLKTRKAPHWQLTFDPNDINISEKYIQLNPFITNRSMRPKEFVKSEFSL
jgi:hypothetical protein